MGYFGWIGEYRRADSLFELKHRGGGLQWNFFFKTSTGLLYLSQAMTESGSIGWLLSGLISFARIILAPQVSISLEQKSHIFKVFRLSIHPVSFHCEVDRIWNSSFYYNAKIGWRNLLFLNVLCLKIKEKFCPSDRNYFPFPGTRPKIGLTSPHNPF